MTMRILALEPYYGGSHRAFLDAWAHHSQHDWQPITLPAHHWKWRMRHAAITCARETRSRQADGQHWDLIFCSDMLNLAEFLALAPDDVARLPTVCYFHENQLTYPDEYRGERDYHFAITNFITALTADEVWFNSSFHREAYCSTLHNWLKNMPEDRCLAEVRSVEAKATVQAPGIEVGPPRTTRAKGPVRIVWAARWEHDKAPEAFFEALFALQDAGYEFRLSVLGQSFAKVPPIFAEARRRLGDRVDHWGFLEDQAAYQAALRAADLFVSTAVHEFFGLSACEAMGQGAIPVLPRRLAYPELLQLEQTPAHEQFFYDDGRLTERLRDWIDQLENDQLILAAGERARKCMSRFDWAHRAAEMDERLRKLSAEPEQGHRE